MIANLSRHFNGNGARVEKCHLRHSPANDLRRNDLAQLLNLSFQSTRCRNRDDLEALVPGLRNLFSFSPVPALKKRPAQAHNPVGISGTTSGDSMPPQEMDLETSACLPPTGLPETAIEKIQWMGWREGDASKAN